MRKHLFYIQKKDLNPGDIVQLSDFDSKHAVNSLRLKKGDTVYLFNGDAEYTCSISLLSKSKTELEVIRINKRELKKQKKLTLLQAIIKNKAMELVLEKSTELGVDEIIPIEFDFSVIKKEVLLKKKERWNSILISAAKQSGRIKVPNIQEPIAFNEIFKNYNEIIVFDNESSKHLKPSSIAYCKDLTYLIGPEGGYSKREKEVLQSNQIQSYKLPFNILKAETAAIAATTILTYLSE